jgi:hypothetical protein
MIAADMIEDAIKHDTQPAIMSGIYERRKVCVVAEPLIDAKMINRIVAMGGRRKDRSEQEAGGAKIDGVVQPAGETAEAMRDGGAGDRILLSADKAKRVNLPPNRSLAPRLIFLTHPADHHLLRIYSTILGQAGISGAIGDITTVGKLDYGPGDVQRQLKRACGVGQTSFARRVALPPSC